MFGQKSAFATPPTNTFGAQSTPFGAQPSNTFGAAPNVTPFGAPGASFGQPANNTMGGFGTPNAGGGLFGGGMTSQPPPTGGGGLFGAPGAGGVQFGAANPTPAFGGNTSFGAASAFNKPGGAGGFGAPANSFGQPHPTNTGGGLFGSAAPNTGGAGLFGQAGGAGSFGGAQATPFGATNTFGQAAAPNGTTIKFNAPTGSDTMLKSGVTTNINTRHQCITCMKEYETKSIEELRFDDYMANRKGGGSAVMGGMGQPTGGLFGGAAPNPGLGGGGFFGANTSTASTQGNAMFGQQQAKPLFGAAGTTGFGTQVSAAPTGFGQPNNTSFGAPSGGLFGAKPGGFGAPTSNTAFGAFGQTTTTQAGGMFGQQQNKPAFNLGAPAAAQPQGGLFGSTQGGFGTNTAQPAFGTMNTGFGMPNQNAMGGGGLFGQQQQNKPTGFGGFGSTVTSSAPAFGGGFGTNTATQAAPFGQAKPGFGFGTSTANTSSAFGFGGAPTQQAGVGGLFGQQKPAGLSFGATTSMGQPAMGTTGFGVGGAFGATNSGGGGMFGAPAQNKPGGMFGTTGSAFGTTTTGGFGTTSMGGGSSFGTGLSTGFGAQNPGGQFGGLPQAPQPAPASQNAIQQQLIQLTSSPYGDNPLFKNLLQDSGKREEILKPINPASQKALDAHQYKVSPHRNIKAKAKPINGLANRSAIFDGLEDDDVNTSNEMFVPRTSVKKLSLKAKSPTGTPQTSDRPDERHNLNNTSVVSPSENNKSLEESLNLPAVRPRDGSNNVSNVSVIDDSFMVLNPKKTRSKDKDGAGDEVNQSSECSETGDDDTENNPSGVRLRRKGYYTMPSLPDLANMVDAKGNCNVENFTVGRVGYGNIFIPGITNVAGMNLDEIVFIRYKEVIVYPDESKKPALGEGLNRKAQITLDKVWPVDKTTRDYVTSPHKLVEMSYEERLQKACLKLGARFVEYRPETGSWVFKVEHFSRYGLDDSDEEDPTKDPKKAKPGVPMKTILESKAVSSAERTKATPTSTTTTVTVHAESSPSGHGTPIQHPTQPRVSVPTRMDQSDLSSSRAMSPPAEQLAQIRASAPKVMMMKASLFDDEEESMDVSTTRPNKARAVILEPRKTILEKRDPMIDDIAHSLLMGTSQRGPSAASSLLRSRFLVDQDQSSSMAHSSTGTPSKRIPTYSLHSAYDKFVTLPSSGVVDRVKTIVPKHANVLPPLQKSLLAQKHHVLADLGLFMSRQFRVGWATPNMMANIGDISAPVGPRRAHDFGRVCMERVNTSALGRMDDIQIQSMECWLEVNLEHSKLSLDNEIGEACPQFAPEIGVDNLQAHVKEANQQLARQKSTKEAFGRSLQHFKQVFDLCDVLWGRIVEENWLSEPDTHIVTMSRREGLSRWLHNVVGPLVKRNLNRAKAEGDSVDEILSLLEGNHINEACERAQASGDHFAALLMASSGGNNSVNGQMILQQMEKWQEMQADKYIKPNRLRLYAILAGIPTWAGTDKYVNVCEDLDWKQALAMELWYLTSPVASIEDALLAYEDAFEGSEDTYSQEPSPQYMQGSDGRTFDVKYHVLKLYTNRSHPMEVILTPATHTPDSLDHRLSWLLAKVLSGLGYHHMSPVKSDALHLSFASQLESMGLWHWAVFALLHLADPKHRKLMIIDTVARHVQLSNEDSDVRETFLHDRLHVPLGWIAQAKATKASSEGSPKDQAYYLIKAQFWNEAHRVIVTKVAPEAIINEDYDYLMLLLNALSPEAIASGIAEWGVQGKVFHDFVTVDRDVKKLVKTLDEDSIQYEIERLRPIIGSLASRISSLRTETAKERLCRAEIAKRVAHLMRAIFSLEAAGGGDAVQGAGPSRALAEHLSQLPLPEDYALQELRTLTRNYMIEIIES